MEKSEKKITDRIRELHDHISFLKKTINKYESEIYSLKSDLYLAQEELLHINEILRLAKIQFPRLRNQKENILTEKDYEELTKWIFRAKSLEGLKDIINAMTELKKYGPKDIKTNLYGLVQKIIIEGPFPKKLKEY